MMDGNVLLQTQHQVVLMLWLITYVCLKKDVHFVRLI